MKNKLFWIIKYSAVGLFIITMLFSIGCSGSGDKNNPFANNTGEPDSNDSSDYTGISGIIGITNDILDNIDPPGSLDKSFGTNGIVTTPIGSRDDFAYALRIQSNGKIVAAGSCDDIGGFSDFALVRYNTDGSLDTSFGTNGKVRTPIGSRNDSARALAVQSDGRIVAAGYSWNGSNNDFALVRYNRDGSLDTSFGTGGIVTTPIGSSNEQAYALGIQSDGKIVAAGWSYNGSNNDFALVRYNANGKLDKSFGTDGIVSTPIGSHDDFAYALGIQSDGRIVVAGFSWNSSNADFALVRYNIDGTPDTSFGTNGIVITPIGTSHENAYALGIQSDGKILAAGECDTGGHFEFGLVRYNIDGSLDASFGTGGKVTTPLEGNDDEAYALGIQSDGKIVVTGYSQNDTGNNEFGLVRYNTDGSRDTSFGTDGIVTTAVGGSDDEAYALGIQSDGRIIAVGYSKNTDTGNYDFALVRYWPSSTIGNLW